VRRRFAANALREVIEPERGKNDDREFTARRAVALERGAANDRDQIPQFVKSRKLKVTAIANESPRAEKDRAPIL